MALLEVKNLHAEVGDKKILNGFDLTVEEGKVLRTSRFGRPVKSKV